MDLADIVDALRTEVRSLRARVAGMVLTGVVRVVNEATKARGLQIEVGDAEPRPCQHAEPYGFTSRAGKGAEAVVLRVGGSASHGIAICVGDRSYRLHLADDLDVAMYDAAEQAIVLTRSGIQVAAPLGMDVDGNLTAGTLSADNGTTGAVIPVYNDGTPGQLAGVSFDHGIVTAHVVVPSP